MRTQQQDCRFLYLIHVSTSLPGDLTELTNAALATRAEVFSLLCSNDFSSLHHIVVEPYLDPIIAKIHRDGTLPDYD